MLTWGAAMPSSREERHYASYTQDLRCTDEAVPCCHRPLQTHTSHAGPYLVVTGPTHNESILCHRPSSRTINVTCPPVVPFIRLTPRGHQHPAELQHAGTMMPRHTMRTSDMTPQIARDQYRQSQYHKQPPYSVLDTTDPGQLSQMPVKTAVNARLHRKYLIIAKVKRQSQ